MKASDITMDKNISILLKSPWGFGKTIAATSFALEGPIYLAYFDKKSPVELLSFYNKFNPALLKNIEYDVYGAHNANEYLNKLMTLSKDCRYTAVITDSVTNLTSAAVNWSLGFRDNKKGLSKDKLMPDFDEYKVETSLVTQALDICRTLPAHIIWTCHPVPSIKIEGSGGSMRVTKTNPIVTYGSKVAGIVPGNFSEIYHFSKQVGWDAALGKSTIKYLVDTDVTGDDFAKSNLGLKGQLDITDKLFYSVWKEEIKKIQQEAADALKARLETPVNPFANNSQELKPTENEPAKKWNSEKGRYEP